MNNIKNMTIAQISKRLTKLQLELGNANAARKRVPSRRHTLQMIDHCFKYRHIKQIAKIYDILKRYE